MTGASYRRSSIRLLSSGLQIALEWLHIHVAMLCCHVLEESSTDADLQSDVAKRSVMAASSVLGLTTACVILLTFAAELRHSYWNG